MAGNVNAGGPYFGVGTSPVALNGTVPIGWNATWSSDGTGTFTDSSDPDTSYTPSLDDVTSGSVELTLWAEDGIGGSGTGLATLTLTAASSGGPNMAFYLYDHRRIPRGLHLRQEFRSSDELMYGLPFTTFCRNDNAVTSAPTISTYSSPTFNGEGTLYMIAVALKAGETITGVRLFGGAVSSGGTTYGAKVALYSGLTTGAVLLAQSSTQEVGWGAAAALFNTAFTAPYTTKETGLFYVGICQTGTGTPTYATFRGYGATSIPTAMNSGPFGPTGTVIRVGTADTGIALSAGVLPLPAAAATITVTSGLPWVALY